MSHGDSQRPKIFLQKKLSIQHLQRTLSIQMKRIISNKKRNVNAKEYWAKIWGVIFGVAVIAFIYFGSWK